MEITGINERLNSDTLSQDERNEERKQTTSKGIYTRKNGRTPGKGYLCQSKTRIGHKWRMTRKT